MRGWDAKAGLCHPCEPMEIHVTGSTPFLPSFKLKWVMVGEYNFGKTCGWGMFRFLLPLHVHCLFDLHNALISYFYFMEGGVMSLDILTFLRNPNENEIQGPLMFIRVLNSYPFNLEVGVLETFLSLLARASRASPFLLDEFIWKAKVLFKINAFTYTVVRSKIMLLIYCR